MADLLNLDVEVVFHDTTSLHFEVDEEDTGVGEDDEVRGSRAAGAKTYRAVRKRGMLKNGRGDVPQVMVGLPTTSPPLQQHDLGDHNARAPSAPSRLPEPGGRSGMLDEELAAAAPYRIAR